jgi:hypothetical protein
MPFGLSAVAVKVIGIGLLVLALIAGYALFVAHEKELGAADERAKSSAAAMKMAQDNAAKSAQIVATQQGAIHDAQLQASAARADASRAAAAGDAYRMRLDAFVSASRGPKYPGPASGSAPASDPIGVLAEVLRSTDDFAARVAAEADANRIAGLACERSYDALTAKP